LITWNLHGTPDTASPEGRFRNVTRSILERHPDLVLLQEVWFRGDADTLTRGLRAAYTKLEDDNAITRHLFGWLIGFRKSGLLAFRRVDSVWSVSDNRSSCSPFRVAAPKWRVLEMDCLAGKGFQRLVVQGRGRRLVLVNTHLQSPYRADEDPFGASHPY